MKINVKYQNKKDLILVRRISWKQRCEEQLDKINSVIEKLNNDLREIAYESH